MTEPATPLGIADVVASLDRIAFAVRSNDGPRIWAAVVMAMRRTATDEQIGDAIEYGRKTTAPGLPLFDLRTLPALSAARTVAVDPELLPEATPTVRRERCHDCSCHINPPCGRCENCQHADYPECENDCQDCEDHQEEPAPPAPVHTTTCTDWVVNDQRGTTARCTCGWVDSWGIQGGNAEASAYAHSKTHAVNA